MAQIDTHVANDVKTCLKVFPVLAVLILITVFVHQAHLPYKIQLIIELIKVCIVVGYFLHLISNRREINNVWLLTIVFVVVLLLLPIANGMNHLTGTENTSLQVQSENSGTLQATAEEEHNVH